MKVVVGLLLVLTIAVAGVFWFGNDWTKEGVFEVHQPLSRAKSRDGNQASLPLEVPPQTGDTADYRNFVNLLSEGAVESSLENIEKGWHSGSAAMLLEVVSMVSIRRNPRSVGQVFDLLRKKTGQGFANDRDEWFRWIWGQEYRPHPQYTLFKTHLYSRVDVRFAEYFVETEDATIRLDEIRWGGVVRDGIPPLKVPEMMLAQDAQYLADTDVVFGIAINDDFRCYPKRILAWHEMFKDTIGGQSVCGVY